jgi:hypothetical protein
MPPKKTTSGFLALMRGQDGHEVGGLVVGELLRRRLGRPPLAQALDELFGHALAVGGAVVDDGDRFALQLVLDGVAAQRAAQLALSLATTRKVVL